MRAYVNSPANANDTTALARLLVPEDTRANAPPKLQTQE